MVSPFRLIGLRVDRGLKGSGRLELFPLKGSINQN